MSRLSRTLSASHAGSGRLNADALRKMRQRYLYECEYDATEHNIESTHEQSRIWVLARVDDAHGCAHPHNNRDKTSECQAGRLLAKDLQDLRKARNLHDDELQVASAYAEETSRTARTSDAVPKSSFVIPRSWVIKLAAKGTL